MKALFNRVSGRWAQPLYLSLLLASAPSMAHADAVMPFTASELPVMATTPNLVYGTFGPQVLLDTTTFTNIPQPLYLDKALEETLTSTQDGEAAQSPARTVAVARITLTYDARLKKEPHTLSEEKQTLSLEGIQDWAQKGLQQCQEMGYVCDAAVSVQDGSLNIALTPLILESVQVDGEGERQKKALHHLLRWIKPNQPFHLHDVARQLRLIQSNPDLPLTAELSVVPYSRQIQMKVTATEEKKPYHAIASWNNLDQPIFGRQFGAVTQVHNNVTGHGDSLMVGVVQGYRSTSGFSHYEYPVTPAFRPFVEASVGYITPFQQLYEDSNTKGLALRVTSGLKYVLLDRPTARLSADVNFDFKQGYSYAQGDVLEREAVRTLRGGINYDQKWKTAALSMRHEFAGGIPILGGSLSNDPRLSWFKGGSQYFRYTGYGLVTKQLPLDSTLTLNTQWQFTPNGLSNFDVGGLGGTFYGRGYREVYLFVDSYTLTSLQWQVPARFLPKRLKLPFASKPLRDTTSLLAFVDYGYGKISAAPPRARPR